MSRVGRRSRDGMPSGTCRGGPLFAVYPNLLYRSSLRARITKMKDLSKGSGRNHSLTILAAASLRLALGDSRMNVITMASRKGGAGKSTLTAHLAAYCHQSGNRCTIIDADPQGSLTLWHSLRRGAEPQLRNGARGIDRALAMAMVEGY